MWNTTKVSICICGIPQKWVSVYVEHHKSVYLYMWNTTKDMRNKNPRRVSAAADPPESERKERKRGEREKERNIIYIFEPPLHISDYAAYCFCFVYRLLFT